MLSQPRQTPAPALAAALAIALLASGGSRTEADPRLTPPLVRTATVAPSAAATSSYSGIVSARVQSNLGFRVPGKVVERLVDAGEQVRKGQPLMRLDRTDLALADTASIGQVEAAGALALQTAADEKRLRGLVDAGAVSASTYDQAKAAADAAAARLRAAQAQATVSGNEAGYAVLLADSDGTVVDTLAEPGTVVTAGQVVVRLAHAGPREALVELPETVRPAIGTVARASLFGGNGNEGNARLRLLSDAADPVTRTFEARFILDGDAAKAPLGSTVVVHLPRTGATGKTVPISAIFDNGKGPGVWVVRGKAVSFRPVTITALGDETVSIGQGLSDGDTFVALGAHQLHEGELVRTAASGVTP
jgi:RND family efflux transporter MFP subunit